MQLLFGKLLTLQTGFFENLQVGISVSLVALGKMARALGQPPCAWIVSISGQEIRKGKVWDKRKQASAVGSAD